MKKIITMLTAVFMLAMSCVAFASTDISNEVIQAEGFGAPNQTTAMGYRAAKIDAMRNLLEEVKAVNIDSESTVEAGITTSDIVKAKVNGAIRGSKVVKKWKDAEGYHVVVELGVFGDVGSLAEAVVPQVQQVMLPEPTAFQSDSVSSSTGAVATVMPVTAPVHGNYTGLIVDCTGLGLNTAMAPGIYAENNEIVYGLEHVSHEQVIRKGYVGYSNGMNNVTRAGSNPLIVKAVSLRDNNIRPVVSNEDAMNILSENRATGFLTAGNVVFIK